MIHSEHHRNGIRARPKQLSLPLKRKRERENSRIYLLMCETRNGDGFSTFYEKLPLFRQVQFLEIHITTHSHPET